MNQKTWAKGVVTFFLGALSIGCQSGGVGDPCLPEDEYQQFFSGYSKSEVNLESRSFQCETRLCLVNHFQGRVSCPYGGTGDTDTRPDEQRCHIPGSTGDAYKIMVPVNPQYQLRQRNEAVYCSCRCAGEDPEGRYCKCPTGFQCFHLLDPVDRLGSKELAGSYCVKDGTAYIEGDTDVGTTCTVFDPGSNPPGDCGKWDGSN
jgi:hypothetical protein